MTLILSLISTRFILQVSDRLLSRSGAEFDPLANKNVVYLARNAILTIGYSGYGYLDGEPTDQWIAQRLRGKPLGPGLGGRGVPALAIGPSGHWLDLGQTLFLLQSDLQKALTSIRPRRYDHDVVFAGWQWNREGRCRPVLAWLSAAATTPDVTVGQLPRHWYYEKGRPRMMLCATPSANFKQSEMQALIHELSGAAHSDQAEEILVRAIRNTATSLPGIVGRHCMSILLPPPSSAPNRARYLPGSPTRAEVRHSKGAWSAPAAFTPWVIGPGIAAAPSIWVGPPQGATVHLGGFQVNFEGVEGGSQRWSAWSSQSRPRV